MNTYEQLKAKYGLTEEMLSGTDEDGNAITLEIDEEKAMIVTSQINGWHRIDTYWSDGSAEEGYEK